MGWRRSSQTGVLCHLPPPPQREDRMAWGDSSHSAQRPGGFSPRSQALGEQGLAFNRSRLRSRVSQKEGDGATNSRSPGPEASARRGPRRGSISRALTLWKLRGLLFDNQAAAAQTEYQGHPKSSGPFSSKALSSRKRQLFTLLKVTCSSPFHLHISAS